MEKFSPKIIKDGTSLAVSLQNLEGARRIENIDFILDIDPQNNEAVGIEIINLQGQIGDYHLESYTGSVSGLNWSVTYDSNDDVAYVGFQKRQIAKTETKQLRGNVLISGDQVVGFECKV